MTDTLAEPADRLLADRNAPEVLRKLYRGASLQTLSDEMAQLGYESALVDECAGGLGLRLADLTALLITLGRRLCPVPLGHTMVARALLARAGAEPPLGHVLLVTPQVDSEGCIRAPTTPLALGATHALLDLHDRHVLVGLAEGLVSPSAPGLSLAADLEWDRLPAGAMELSERAGPLRPTAALLSSATIAGCIAAALDLTTAHAFTRKQFGKPIVDFQAIQQQLAVLAEEAAAAAMAVAIGCDGPGPLAAELPAAIAKMRTSMAAPRATAIAHAVHGAIGFSEEYDLQLFTRRMSEESLANGGDAYWAERIGQARLGDRSTSSLEFVRSQVGAEAVVEAPAAS